MKEKFFLAVIGLFVLTASQSQSLHNVSIRNIDSISVSLSSYVGTKTLVIIAPVRLYDTARVNQIKAFQQRYGDTVKLVGIISIEDGYVDSNKAMIKGMYEARGINILLTVPMRTRTQPDGSEPKLIKWLARKTENKQSDNEILGIFQKFFINKAGKIYSVLQPEVPLNAPVVKRNVQLKN